MKRQNEKIRSGLLVLVIIAAALLISIGYRFTHEEMLVDDCLSGKHGSFDYSTMSCDVAENHNYVPYAARHPHDASNAAIAFLAFGLFSSGYVYMRVKSRRR